MLATFIAPFELESEGLNFSQDCPALLDRAGIHPKRTIGGSSVRASFGIMGPVIGEVLPYALGIAISPVPIIAVILLLMSSRARSTSVGFLLGWLVGIVVAIVVFTALSSIIPQADPDASNPIGGVIKLILGAALLFLAVRQWMGRPKEGEEAKLPKWMSAIDSLTVGRAFVLGFVLAAVNPKNLIMAIAAGYAIGAAGLTIGSIVIVILIFVVLAASTVLIPVLGFLIAGERAKGPLVEHARLARGEQRDDHGDPPAGHRRRPDRQGDRLVLDAPLGSVDGKEAAP